MMGASAAAWSETPRDVTNVVIRHPAPCSFTINTGISNLLSNGLKGVCTNLMRSHFTI